MLNNSLHNTISRLHLRSPYNASFPFMTSVTIPSFHTFLFLLSFKMITVDPFLGTAALPYNGARLRLNMHWINRSERKSFNCSSFWSFFNYLFAALKVAPLSEYIIRIYIIRNKNIYQNIYQRQTVGIRLVRFNFQYRGNCRVTPTVD